MNTMIRRTALLLLAVVADGDHLLVGTRAGGATWTPGAGVARVSALDALEIAALTTEPGPGGVTDAYLNRHAGTGLQGGTGEVHQPDVLGAIVAAADHGVQDLAGCLCVRACQSGGELRRGLDGSRSAGLSL